MQKSLTQLGVTPMPMSTVDMDQLIVRDMADNREVISRAGIKAQ